MDFISDEYRRNLAAKWLVLRALRSGPLSGDDLILQFEAACVAAARAIPDFHFVGWAGGGIWENLDLFLEWGFIAVAGGRPENPAEWRASVLELTDAGARFLETAEHGAKGLLEVLAKAVPVSAAG